MISNVEVPGSFRDPSGFLFFRNGVLFRQINQGYKQDYDHLMRSGLYSSLVEDGLLIPHKEADTGISSSEKQYKVIQPTELSFISYPYEWCFSQLKNAALTTLKIQKQALKHNMSLKDCSAYNIQFFKGKPLLIDTLSFECYREGEPWVAYRQFCQHFLAPLVLMSHKDIRLNQLLRIYIDGVPLDLASSLLPFSTWFRFSVLSHIHLHAIFQQRYGTSKRKNSGRKMSQRAIEGIVDSLESSVRKLRWQPGGTEWNEYYEDTNYSGTSFHLKKEVVSAFLDRAQGQIVWDMGANTGVFSRIASGKGMQTVAFDIDFACVERNYLESIVNKEIKILPLVLDLTNPSSGIGWAHEERMSLIQRGPVDIVMALALIHHLAISNNLPLQKISAFFSKICKNLIIEFVPKSDSQVKRLLAARKDIFPDYTSHGFEGAFKRYFSIDESVKLGDSERTLYRMHRN